MGGIPWMGIHWPFPLLYSAGHQWLRYERQVHSQWERSAGVPGPPCLLPTVHLIRPACLSPMRSSCWPPCSTRCLKYSSQLSPTRGAEALRCGRKTHSNKTASRHWQDQVCGAGRPYASWNDFLLWKIYEIYSDIASKKPLVSLGLPIRCELFEHNLKLALEMAEKPGTFGPG